ncbi:hypothetical protein AXG93_3546s1050 [Marchantia polymorpha subsp. ruderalis]|uniref:Uncharacterized protein n=1 Tax=Marchantia polymorpha subsp. ruderalis TaxID=1480154 RepID=A0A176WQF6_MARPO|nr:hypothetical protein AXG93_3546s1050 [Marchantia polymorpha subsp. ruderalis]
MAEVEVHPQVSSLDSILEEPKEKYPESSNRPAIVRPLPSLDGWRGLAHYRTESRRNVVKKKPQDRTPSDLYILEESVKSVKLIGDLPLAKRLEARPSYLTFFIPSCDTCTEQEGEKDRCSYVGRKDVIRHRSPS